MFINWAHRIRYARSEWVDTHDSEWRQLLSEWFYDTFPERVRYAVENWFEHEPFPQKAGPLTALRLPDLGLPRMSPEARMAFAAALQNESAAIYDLLRLAAARGFTVHPRDWVPKPTDRPRYPDLYRPWAVWLAEKAYTRYSAAVPLTPENTQKFRRRARNQAFENLYRDDRAAAYDLLIRLAEIHDEDVRCDLLNEIGGRGLFNGNYPWDVPILKHFQNDPSEKVRDFVTKRLQAMAGRETVGEVANRIAQLLEVKGAQIVAAQPAYSEADLFVARYCTTVEALADAVGLTATEFARRLDFDLMKSDFWYAITTTGSVEVRTIAAERMIAAGHNGERGLYRDLPRSLWEQGLRATFQSPYMFAVNDFLGPDIGTIDATMMRDLGAYQAMEPSVLGELETGELPVNTSHDPLRVLGLALSRSAAEQVLKEAIDLGMAQDNPRLLMLKYNLQL
ncbi:hypothetical protein K3X44_05825 [Aliiroseovarius crassostreae]|uniref:hypothetical protein n=1 Tax=Aliiroseovarius crassostreae TaxID=154981 RepID=UPI0021F9D438|nr:hypothetical protein [Aliiroseovarius crassostreae]UWQ02838.1 hypothetical protein K3X44_05825 [Aliiroseovarius crassostreae]